MKPLLIMRFEIIISQNSWENNRKKLKYIQRDIASVFFLFLILVLHKQLFCVFIIGYSSIIKYRYCS